MSANPHTSAALKPGDKLDKYDVLEQIAVGGMSIVWKGYDRLLGKHVAIKQIALELQQSSDAMDAFRERFRKEAAIQRRISVDQKHLVRIYDFIDDERGLFIVMEYVDGPSLEQMLQQMTDPMPPRQALGIIGATARALQAIHDQGVVHRDLKPSNILMPRDGGLKVCDFGLATLMADQEGMSMGSVRYLAPEAFGSGPVDARADIYSLGMIAYELLAGRSGFEEAFRLVLRDQRNQALRWMKWHTNPRAKAPPLTQLVPSLDPALADLVERMMAKDPAARIDSAKEVLKAIRRHATGESEAAAAKVTVDAKARAAAVATAMAHEATAVLPRKSKLPWILAGTVAFWCIVAVGLVLYFQAGEKAQQEELLRAADEAFNRAQTALREKDYERARAGFEELAEEWPDHPRFGRESTGLALYAKALAAMENREYSRAERLLEELDSLQIFGNRDRIQELLTQARAGDAFQREMDLIRAHVAAGRFDDARLRLAEQRAIIHPEDRVQIIEEVGALIEDQAALAAVDDVLRRATAAAQRGNRAEALAMIRTAQERHSDHRLQELYDQIDADARYAAFVAQAEQAVAAGDLAAAIQAYDAALEIRPNDALMRKANQVKSQAAYDEGQRLLAEGDTAGAQAAFTRAMGFADVDNELARQALDQIATTSKAIGFVMAGDQAAAAGDFDQAITQYRNALAIAQDPTVTQKLRNVQAQAHMARGRRLMAQRDLDAAKQAFVDAQTLAPNLPGLAEAIQELDRTQRYLKELAAGDNARRQSRFGEAIRAYSRAKDVIETEEINKRIEDARFDQFIATARTYMEAKNWAAARASLDTAARIRTTDELKRLYEELAKVDPVPSQRE